MAIDNPSDPEDELPDWLSSLGADEGDSDDPFGDSSEEEVPEWMSSDTSEGGKSQSSQEEEVPDWLAGIRDSEDSGEPFGSQTFDSTPSETGENADWLDNIRSIEGQDVEDLPSEDSGDFIERIQSLKEEDSLGGEGADQEDTSDWLGGLSDQDDADPLALGDDAAADEGQDWLSGLSVESDSTESDIFDFPEEQAADQEGQDLFGSVGEPSETDDGSLNLEQGLEESEEVPNWLSSFDADSLDQDQEPDTSSPPGDPPSGSDVFGEEFVQVAENVVSEFPGLPDEPGEAAGIAPSWLEDLQDSAPDLGITGNEDQDLEVSSSEVFTYEEKEDTFILEPTDLPEWLDEEGEGAGAQDPDPQAIGLAPAELPSWLQAMRPTEAGPVERAASVSQPGEEESIGPLAGLIDVLPAEVEIIQFGQTSTPSSSLNITDAQLSHIKTLQKLIENEEAASPVLPRTVALPQQILRWVIAILLYTIVFIPIFLRNAAVALPDPASKPEVVRAASDIVNNLPNGAPVLLAFEYRPGLSGELETAAAEIVNNMLLKGAQLITISTQPTGRGQAEYFLQRTQSGHSNIAQGNYVNLGYLSGGNAGLLNFATDPRGTVPLQNEDGTSQWDQLPLAGIQNIQNFFMVVVITEDPDTARAWIEQVQPYLVTDETNQTPLIMVVSAQTEPLVRPYFETSPKQVSGIISGIKGGAFYETGLLENLARSYWDAYNIGLGIAILIIIIGSVFNVSRMLLSSGDNSKKRGSS